MRWLALGAGIAAGAGVAFAVTWLVKKPALEARAQALQAQVEDPSNAGQIAQETAAMRTRLQTYAAQQADVIARRAAEEHLASAYGLTQARLQRISDLSRALHIG